MPREPRPIKTARPSASRTTPPRAQRLLLQAQDGPSYPQGAGVEHRRFRRHCRAGIRRLQAGRPGSRGTFDVKTGTAATAGSVVSDWMLRQCTGAPKTATDKCVATFDAATGVMTFTMILLPQTLANALVLEISPDDEEYQSYSNKDMIKPALEAGYSYTYTITVKKTGLTLSGSTIENWNDGGSHAGDAKM